MNHIPEVGKMLSSEQLKPLSPNGGYAKFGAMDIVALESPATYDTITHVIQRTIKERLFSFHPFKKTKIEFEHKPKPIVLNICGKLYCHPKILEKIMNSAKEA